MWLLLIGTSYHIHIALYDEQNKHNTLLVSLTLMLWMEMIDIKIKTWKKFQTYIIRIDSVPFKNESQLIFLQPSMGPHTGFPSLSPFNAKGINWGLVLFVVSSERWSYRKWQEPVLVTDMKWFLPSQSVLNENWQQLYKVNCAIS